MALKQGDVPYSHSSEQRSACPLGPCGATKINLQQNRTHKVELLLRKASGVWEKWRQLNFQEQEAQGLGALLNKVEDNDPIELDNIEV